MTEATSLFEFLEAAGAQLRIYDMGRRVSEIPRDTFLRFESTEIPYPQPLKGQAWFGISMLDQEKSAEPVIWFLRLPLDEQGKLVLAVRDYFLSRLMEVAILQQGKKRKEKAIEDAFKDNPHIFKPREDRMAVFHAKLTRDLGRAASRYYEHAQQYFSGAIGWDQWEFVGLQGIADLAARWQQSDNLRVLTAAIHQLPQQPLIALCHCLENEPIPLPLSDELLHKLDTELAKSSPRLALVTALLRGLSDSVSQQHRRGMIERVLASHLGHHIEVLAAISGRAWEELELPDLTSRYLEALARCDEGQAAFNECLRDLLAIPGLREPVLSAIRNPARSDRLAEAFASMLQQS